MILMQFIAVAGFWAGDFYYYYGSSTSPDCHEMNKWLANWVFPRVFVYLGAIGRQKLFYPQTRLTHKRHSRIAMWRLSEVPVWSRPSLSPNVWHAFGNFPHCHNWSSIFPPEAFSMSMDQFQTFKAMFPSPGCLDYPCFECVGGWAGSLSGASEDNFHDFSFAMCDGLGASTIFYCIGKATIGHYNTCEVIKSWRTVSRTERLAK